MKTLIELYKEVYKKLEDQQFETKHYIPSGGDKAVYLKHVEEANKAKGRDLERRAAVALQIAKYMYEEQKGETDDKNL